MNDFIEFNLEKFLQAREERVEFQLSLLQNFKKTLLVVRANYPGKLKTQYPANEIVNILTSEVKNLFSNNTLYFNEKTSPEGFITTFIIDETSEEVKKSAIFIEENHPLGRFVDIDVYSHNGDSLSRSSFGYPKRKCYLCDEMAVVCSRNATHSLESLTTHILKSYEKFLLIENLRTQISENLGELALKACILELSCHPSFGLVSPISSGSHKDMNYFTFLDSSFAIKKGLTKMGKMAFSYLSMEEIFKRSRELGIATEKEMFSATKGVNTHKGMIFLLGISIIATCKTLYKFLPQNNFENSFSINDELLNDISNNIKICCSNLLTDFEKIPDKIAKGEILTHGENLYLKYGFLGLRGEVANGLSLIFQNSLPFLEEELSKEDNLNIALVKTLLLLMSKVEDSTIIHRGGIETLKKVQNDASSILKHDFNLDTLYLLEKEYISKNISPGGSADLLAVTIFFYFLKKIKLDGYNF